MTNLANRLPDKQAPVSAAAFNARRDINRDKYAASGYIEPGKQFEGSNVFYYGPGGMWTTPTLKNAIRFGRNSRDGTGVSSSGNPIFHVDGLVIEMRGLNWPSEENNQIDLPDAPSAYIEPTTRTTRDYQQGDHVIVGNDIYVCLHPLGSNTGDLLSDVELFERDDFVTREDLVGIEVFLVRLGDASGAIDAVYPYGNVQYKPAAVDDQFSLSTNAMPQSYSAMYLGDTLTTGRGLKWSELTPEQRNLWAQKSENNIYVEDGKYYQWQYRARVIRSRGGSWRVATAFDTNNSALEDHRSSYREGTLRYASPQGKLTAPPPDHQTAEDSSDFNYLLTTNHGSFDPNVNKGVAAASDQYNSNGGISEGNIYFLSLAAIRRLNEGGYHPIYNPMGTKTFRRQDINGDSRWENVNTFQATSVADCFKIGETPQSEGYYIHSGLQGSSRSGHPHDFRSDVVYDWQVDDLRMDAHGFEMQPDEFANRLLYNNMPLREPYKVMRLEQTAIKEIVGTNIYYFDYGLLEEWGFDYVYRGGGWLYNHDKDEYAPFGFANHSSGNVIAYKLKDEVLPETLGRFIFNSFVDSGNNLGWEVDDTITFIGYKETENYSALQVCMDIISTPQRLIETFNEYGVDRIGNAIWSPAALGSNGSVGVQVKGRRKIKNPAYTYIKYADTIDVDFDYIANFNTLANSAVITEDSTACLMVLYNTPSNPLKPINFSNRLLDGDFGSMWLTDSGQPDIGGSACYSMIGRVPTGNNYAESNAFQLQKTGLQFSTETGFDLVGTSAFSEIVHADIHYPLQSDGVKFVPFFSVDESKQLVFGQTMYKEVKETIPTRDYRTIDVSTSQEVTLLKGERFKLVGTGLTNIENRYLITLYDFTSTWGPTAFDNYRVDTDDGRIYKPSGEPWGAARLDAISTTGDDGHITPRSWMGQIEDLNNADIRIGTTITRRPLGFLPKRQRRSGK